MNTYMLCCSWFIQERPYYLNFRFNADKVNEDILQQVVKDASKLMCDKTSLYFSPESIHITNIIKLDN